MRPDYIKINELYHYGVKRRSGRYPYGSGERPYQSEPLHRRFVRNIKTTYDKIPQPIKTTARIGIKIGGSILLSQALGAVGGTVVYGLTAPKVVVDAAVRGKDFVKPAEWGGSTIYEDIVVPNVERAKKLGTMAYAGITNAVAASSIGSIVVKERKKIGGDNNGLSN